MKYLLPLLMLVITSKAVAQSSFPDFLQGSWKMENKEIYEHWDRLNENSLKGFSYSVNNGKIAVSEYLDISRIENEVIYTASVLNQNQGKGIAFMLIDADTAYAFQNLHHDFPKKIVYQKLSDTEVFVQVSDGQEHGFSYRMTRLAEMANEMDTTVSNPNYDPRLAKKLGADDYGMKRYMLVMLKTGTNQTTDTDFINACFRGHMENINRLAEKGKLIVAGPLGKNEKNYRGIFILDATTLEEAEALLQTDPAISEKLLDAELYSCTDQLHCQCILTFLKKSGSKNLNTKHHG